MDLLTLTPSIGNIFFSFILKSHLHLLEIEDANEIFKTIIALSSVFAFSNHTTEEKWELSFSRKLPVNLLFPLRLIMFNVF